MKALSLHGPWAEYERKNAMQERRITELEAEVRKWERTAEEAASKLLTADESSKRLRDVELPSLKADKERASSIIDSLQSELARYQLERQSETGAWTEQVSSLTAELQKLSADNAVLRAELAKTVHQKQVTNTKLEQIRKKLGLEASEAKAFLAELDDARAASKALRDENAQLVSDSTHLKQQVESRSQHCMTLINENKRLLEQVADLRMQLQKQQGELWQAKTATSAAAGKQQESAKKGGQVVVREWTMAGDKECGQSARDRGRQNRPPWNDVPTTSSGSTAATAAAPRVATGTVSATAAGRKAGAATGAKVPLGGRSATGSEAVRASVVRQALAVRQQRAGSAAQLAGSGGPGEDSGGAEP